MANLRPLVSVCMPTYNYGRYLEQSISSVFRQTYRPLELIIVDDGSTDDTAEVIKRATMNAPITVKVVMGDHAGVSAALNQALSHASGEWISILAADDIATPNRVEAQMSTVRDDTMIVHSEYTCIDAEGKPVPYDSSTDLPPATGEALRSLLLLRADVRSMTVMLRRSALAAQPYDESLPAEDWQSILRLAAIGRIEHVPEPLIRRRIHLGSASVTGHRKKTSFSFKEIGLDVLREVVPTDMDLEHVCAIHTSVVLRNALAQGAMKKVLDGLKQSFEAFPNERAFILAETARAIPSYFWIHGVRQSLPPRAVKTLLRLKGLAMKAKSTRLND